MENRPTAVQWLTEQLDNYFSQAQKEQTLHLVQIAKQMEQEQLKNEYYRGLDEAINPPYYTEQ